MFPFKPVADQIFLSLSLLLFICFFGNCMTARKRTLQSFCWDLQDFLGLYKWYQNLVFAKFFSLSLFSLNICVLVLLFLSFLLLFSFHFFIWFFSLFPFSSFSMYFFHSLIHLFRVFLFFLILVILFFKFFF